MNKLGQSVVAVLALLLVLVGAVPATADQHDTAADASARQRHEKTQSEIDKLRSENIKLDEEIRKLREEIVTLASGNEPIPTFLRQHSPIMGLLGGLMAAILAFAAGSALNKTQKTKIDQDIMLERERHN